MSILSITKYITLVKEYMDSEAVDKTVDFLRIRLDNLTEIR